MDLRKFSSFILLAGMAVFLYGIFVFLTNQPITTRSNSGNVFKDINLDIKQMGNNFQRATEREDAKRIMIIGGIILFVGVAVRMSIKNSPTNIVVPDKQASVHVWNIPEVASGAIIAVSFFLGWFKYETVSLSGFAIFYGLMDYGIRTVTGSVVNLGRADNVAENFRLYSVLLGGWLIPVCSGLTAYFSYKGSRKAIRSSLITVISSIYVFFILVYWPRFLLFSFGDTNPEIIMHPLKHIDIGIVTLLIGLIGISYSFLERIMRKRQ